MRGQAHDPVAKSLKLMERARRLGPEWLSALGRKAVNARWARNREQREATRSPRAARQALRRQQAREGRT